MSSTDRADQGVVFPADDSGRVSTMAVNQAVFADAARGTDPALAARIEAESTWRTDYIPHIRALLELGMKSTGNAIAISSDGLAGLRTRLQFRRDGGVASIAEAMSTPAEHLGTATVYGTGEGASALSVPYRGQLLVGDDLRRQLDDWVGRGIAEPSFADAVGMVISNPEWLDLADQAIAVMGVGSEMGPYAHLCQWGASIWAVDLPRTPLWRRALATALAGRGAVHVPVPVTHALAGQRVGGTGAHDLAEAAGVDLIAQAPEVSAWLDEASLPLTVGNYVYADGGLHVRVSVAIDAVMTAQQQRRDDLTVAFLATPTDVFSVPWEVVEDARRRYAQRGLVAQFATPVGPLSGGRVVAAHYRGDLAHDQAVPPYGLADNLVARQGPNYALAKRMQRWRATVAREHGARASLNIAPPTRTASVVKNRAFALAYAGMGRFGLEVFDPPTSNALMAAMLVHDLRNPQSSANPAAPLEHPLDLFVDGANPGGMWRSAYEPNTIMGAAAVAGLFERRA